MRIQVLSLLLPTGAKYSASNKYMVAYKAGATVWNGLSWSGSPLVSTTTISAPTFYEVKSEELEDVTELNALYNTSGFSFASKPYDTDQNRGADRQLVQYEEGGSSLCIYRY